MRTVRYCLHLINGEEINIIECYLDPNDNTDFLLERYSEARRTGMLVTGEDYTHQFFIPFENIVFVERFPDDEDDEE